MVIGPLITSRSKVELRSRTIASPGRLAAAGVTIAITTDHPVVPIHFLIHQATLAVKEGLDPVTALRAVTINPARIIGCADRIGSLTPGKDADVVIWSGDPLDVMSRAERAYTGGREITGTTTRCARASSRSCSLAQGQPLRERRAATRSAGARSGEPAS